MALAAERDTKSKETGITVVYGVKASAKIFAGALVAVDATGYLLPAGDTSAHKVQGRAAQTADNTGGASGAITCRVEQGVFKWANSSASAVVITSVGHIVYAEDDQTVKLAAATNTVIAGICTELDADGGIWVSTYLTGGI